MKQLWFTLSRPAKIGSIAGAAASLPFAVYTSIISGTLGGGWGWSLAGAPGTVIGIVLTIALVAGTILLLGVLVGGVIGFMIGRIFKGPQELQR